MKKIVTILIVCYTITLNAQIFINTGQETVKESEKEVVEVVEEVETEIKEVKEEVSTVVEKEETSIVEPVKYRAVASSNLDEVPPNAEPGKCYARSAIPTTYKYISSQEVATPKSVKKIKLPALYKMEYDTIVLNPKTTKQVKIEAEYEYIEEEVMVTPTTTKWVKGQANAGCLSEDPADCQVMYLVEVPATYKTVKRKVMKSEAYTQEVVVPMEYKIGTKEVLVKEESYTEVVIPATYKQVQKRVVDQEGGYDVWVEILCADEVTKTRVTAIQKVLKSKGYEITSIDGVLGKETKAALIIYQKDMGLPMGSLNMETLSSLGVK